MTVPFETQNTHSQTYFMAVHKEQNVLWIYLSVKSQEHHSWHHLLYSSKQTDTENSIQQRKGMKSFYTGALIR